MLLQAAAHCWAVPWRRAPAAPEQPGCRAAGGQGWLCSWLCSCCCQLCREAGPCAGSAGQAAQGLRRGPAAAEAQACAACLWRWQDPCGSSCRPWRLCIWQAQLLLLLSAPLCAASSPGPAPGPRRSGHSSLCGCSERGSPQGQLCWRQLPLCRLLLLCASARGSAAAPERLPQEHAQGPGGSGRSPGLCSGRQQQQQQWGGGGGHGALAGPCALLCCCCQGGAGSSG